LDISWIDVGGVSLPVLVQRLQGGRWAATLADWRLSCSGDDACTALQALTRALHQRLHAALAVGAQRDGAAAA
jgi:hypothetical protein